MSNKQYWFKNRRYGYGWRPASREGWLVIIVYVVSLLLLSAYYSVQLEQGDVFSYVASTIFLTILLIAVCYRTGEPLRLMWGKEVNRTKK